MSAFTYEIVWEDAHGEQHPRTEYTRGQAARFVQAVTETPGCDMISFETRLMGRAVARLEGKTS